MEVCIDSNQSRDFHPAVKLIRLADKVGWHYEITVNFIRICLEPCCYQLSTMRGCVCDDYLPLTKITAIIINS